MTFLHPSYLWALLGLLVPIAIHFWSKKEGKTIKVGSIKLLSEVDSKRSSSVNLNELLLLLVRLSLLALLVLILAKPQLSNKKDPIPLTYLVEPSLVDTALTTAFIDSLRETAPVRLLQKGFPALDDLPDAGKLNTTPQYWQLAKEMEALHTDSIVVFTRALIGGLNGMRPRVNKIIEWVVLDSGEPLKEMISVIQQEEQLHLASVLSNSLRLSFQKEILPVTDSKITFSPARDSVKISGDGIEDWIPLSVKNPISILLFYSETFSNEARYMDAAFSAISKHLWQPIDITKAQDSIPPDLSQYNTIVWLSEMTPLKTDATLLTSRLDHLASSLIVPAASPNEYYLTGPLNVENSVNEYLPEQLMKVLNLDTVLKEKIEAYDIRNVDKAEFLPLAHHSESGKTLPPALPISKWLWILLALILVGERVMTNLRKQ